MIQTIGIMIGVYILVRMAEIVDDKNKSNLLKFCSIFCMAVTLIGLGLLLFSGSPPIARQ